MDSKYYRIITVEVLARISFQAIKGTLDTQRINQAGTHGIVEREHGYSVNSRWMDEETTYLYLETNYDAWNEHTSDFEG